MCWEGNGESFLGSAWFLQPLHSGESEGGRMMVEKVTKQLDEVP